MPHRTRWKTWSATLWLLAGVTAFVTVLIVFLMPETLASNILRRRALRLREHSKAEIQLPLEPATTLTSFLKSIIYQTAEDLKVSCVDPVVLFVNIHTMLIYGVLYLWFEFFPFGKPQQFLFSPIIIV